MSFIIGLLAGTFGSLVGLGGGVVMIPLMVGLLKMEQHRAHGTSLVALIFTGIAGMIVYRGYGSLDLYAAAVLAAVAIFTVRVGAKYAMALPGWKLKRAFGGLLIYVALMMLIKSYVLPTLGQPTTTYALVILLLAGAATGFLSGMLGVGGGAIMVPAMVLAMGFDQHTAQGTSLLAMIPIGIIGAYTHWRMGQVSTETLPWLIPAIIMGSLAGGGLAHYLPETTLRVIFAAVLFGTGIKYLRTPRPGS